MSKKIDDYRSELNEIDEKIIALLCERFRLMPFIANEKKKIGKDIFDRSRENEVIEKRAKIFSKNGFSDDKFVEKLFKLIMDKSKDIQKDSLVD